MKIYLAGQCPYPEAQVHAEATIKKFLYSYLYLKKTPISTMRSKWDGLGIMIDSGGFSVRTGGAAIDVRLYAAFLKRLEGAYDICFNLDTKDMAESLRNQTYLESQGLNPLPVYHYSDFASSEWRDTLQRFIDSYDYISIGGMVKGGLSKEMYKRFLDYVFTRTGKATKVHGLGLTSSHIMSHYPFYSVDSKTWLVSGLYGDFVMTKNAKYKRLPKKKGSLAHYGLMLSGPEKMKRAVDAFNQLERHLTAIWEKRGYSWN